MADKITLRQLREQAGLSRAEVAKALGLSYQAISNYEAGIRTVAIEMIVPLARFYDCSAEDVIAAQLASVAICKPKQIV